MKRWFGKTGGDEQKGRKERSKGIGKVNGRTENERLDGRRIKQKRKNGVGKDGKSTVQEGRNEYGRKDRRVEEIWTKWKKPKGLWCQRGRFPKKTCSVHLMSKKSQIAIFRLKQRDQGCYSDLKTLTHDEMHARSEGSWVMGICCCHLGNSYCRKTQTEVHTVERLGTENSICLGSLLHWSISTPTSTRVIANTSSFSHCKQGGEQRMLSVWVESSAEYTPIP